MTKSRGKKRPWREKEKGQRRIEGMRRLRQKKNHPRRKPKKLNL